MRCALIGENISYLQIKNVCAIVQAAPFQVWHLTLPLMALGKVLWWVTLTEEGDGVGNTILAILNNGRIAERLRHEIDDFSFIVNFVDKEAQWRFSSHGIQ